jgi:hypothetical protein
MFQEVYNHRCIELLQMQSGRGNFETVAGVFEKEFESISIGLTGVFAGTTLNGQALPQKSRYVGSN